MKHEKRYFVGIGAQRAGTTWLSDMFARHPDIGMSPVKETHYWSSKHVDHQRHAVRGLQALRIRMPILLKHCLENPAQAMSWIAAYGGMMAHRDASYRQFIELGRYGARIAGEITPAYATLPEQGFSALDACLDRPKYLLALRNPADRMISQIAHTAGRDPSVLTASADALLCRPYFALRSSYRGTYAACRAVVDAERLFVFFFEDLFDPATSQATYDAICRFLGVASGPADLSHVANTRPKPRCRATRDEIVAALQDDYAFARDTIDGALPKTWRADLERIAEGVSAATTVPSC